MKFATSSNFVKMCRQGIEGAFLGVISGMVLGLVIYYLQFPLEWLTITPDYMDGMMGSGIGVMWHSAAQPGILGACFGALIGAMFGCLLAVKEFTKTTTKGK